MIALLQSISWDRKGAIAAEHVTCNGTIAMLELRLERPGGNLPEFERAVIAFEIQGEQVSAMQSYLLLFHPARP